MGQIHDGHVLMDGELVFGVADPPTAHVDHRRWCDPGRPAGSRCLSQRSDHPVIQK